MKFEINDYRSIKSGYSLYMNGGLVRSNIPNMEEVVKEIKKYLRLRFRESLK